MIFQNCYTTFHEPLGEWNLRQFWNIKSGIYAKYHVQIMLLFVYTTTHKRFVIFTRRYFKLSWNTTALIQSNYRNFSCSSINVLIRAVDPNKLLHLQSKNNYWIWLWSFSDLSLMSATAILLVWLTKSASHEIRLKELKKEAKKMGLTLLRNKDKNTYIRAVAPSLVRKKKGTIAENVALDRVSQDDVSVTNDQ